MEEKESAEKKIDTENRKKLTFVQVLIVFIALVCCIGLIVFSFIKPDNDPTKVEVRPNGGTKSGGIPLVLQDGKQESSNVSAHRVAIDVYLDYMCPYCKEFEQKNGSELEELAQKGNADVYIHPMAVLDSASDGTEYSTRAAEASAYIADNARSDWFAFQQVLFERQPEEMSSGLTDHELAEAAREAGVSDAVAEALPANIASYGKWVKAATRQGIEDVGGHIPQTYFKISGDTFKWNDWNKQGIDKALDSFIGKHGSAM